MESSSTTTAHTGGDWRVVMAGQGVQRLILSEDRLLAIVGGFPDGDPGETEANARLMAAAPDLKDALLVAENAIRGRLMYVDFGTDEYQQLDWVLSTIHTALSHAA